MNAPSLSQKEPSFRETFFHGAAIVLIGLALWVGCWNTDFLGYDDSLHVTENHQVSSGNFLSAFKANSWTYIPLTILSYQLDYKLFAGWMPALLGSWAPGARFMTYVYHAGAALLVWRILLRLERSPLQALVGALIFSVHPTACETVCWISERKNALAGLFGFAALWAWLKFENQNWRPLLVLALFACALLSKPSALGLLPVFVLADLFGGVDGLAGRRRTRWMPGPAWARIALQSAPLVILALAVIWINIKVHETSIVVPPGGSAFTAVLTDLEIVSRYLLNLIAPVWLSAYYFVDPVKSLADWRVPAYAAVLAVSAGLSLLVAVNRRRALFGWLWFIAAMGTNLNIIANAHFMQDRYLYLSLPGLFLVLIEVAAGVESLGVRGHSTIRIVTAVYIACLAGLAIQRGADWRSTIALFGDATKKQPEAAFSHYGFGAALGDAWQQNAHDPALRQQWLREWDKALQCRDAPRFACYYQMALTLGEIARDAGKARYAEHYWNLAAYPPRDATRNVPSQAKALQNLAELALDGPNQSADEAYRKASEAVAVADDESGRFIRGRAALLLAIELRKQGDESKASQLIKESKEDFQAVGAGSHLYLQAKQALEDSAFQ